MDVPDSSDAHYFNKKNMIENLAVSIKLYCVIPQRINNYDEKICSHIGLNSQYYLSHMNIASYNQNFLIKMYKVRR